MDNLQFVINKGKTNDIKVIGVGGGGGNAVNHMYEYGDIHDVSFVLCNTDNQALGKSDVPVKIQLGPKTTRGLGAGSHPEKAERAALESEGEIKEMLSDGTKMVFITAGMGGGTGTGAAPVIARIAKNMGILTVGIVTIPFLFEGNRKIIKALDGVEKIAKNVDALLVINNERLRSIYSDLSWSNAFARADDTLLIAAKSIAEIITLPKTINVDFADVETTLKDGGVAIMATGEASGDNRITNAIKKALESPLLSSNDIFDSKRVLLCVSFGPEHELIMEETDEIHDFMKQFQPDIDVIWGGGLDDSLGDQVKITLLATGFGVKDVANLEDIFPEGENRRTKQEEEAEAKNVQRIEKYYGQAAKHMGRMHQRQHLFLFEGAALDDDDVIALVEDKATYKRDRQTLNKIKKLSAENQEDAKGCDSSDDKEQLDNEEIGVITF